MKNKIKKIEPMVIIRVPLIMGSHDYAHILVPKSKAKKIKSL